MLLIIDGYNVMHALPVEREWPGASFRERRESFLGFLSAYAAGRSHRITVVFDGGKGGDEMGGSEAFGGIRLLYSARGTDADGVIRDLVEFAPDPAEVLLVSSDKSLAGYVRSMGASIARADELVRRLLPVSGREGPGRARRTAKQRHNLW